MNTEILLQIHAYVVMGFSEHRLFPVIAEEWGDGQDRLFLNLGPLTEYLYQHYEQHDYHPGVFVCEVAEPVGKAIADWMLVNATDDAINFPDQTIWIKVINTHCNLFFDPPEPVYTVEHIEAGNTLHEGTDLVLARILYNHYKNERGLNVLLKQDGVEI